jgi:hypothetical protein
MTYRRRLVRPLAMRHVALMTVEGQNDDICSIGQTEAAHELCGNLSASIREHYVQPAVGIMDYSAVRDFVRKLRHASANFSRKLRLRHSVVQWRVGTERQSARFLVVNRHMANAPLPVHTNIAAGVVRAII